MSVSSLRFRIEGENSSALRSIAEVKRSAANLGNELQSHIADKLKGAFTVGIIEEVVRRTGEWATELHRSAQELGVTAERLQTLRVMAERAGVAQDKISAFYNKLEAKATSAANGNQKLLKSFQALGVDIGDLKGPNRLGTSDLFQKTLKGGNQGALQSIYGAKSYLEVKALSREAGGRDLKEYQNAHESQIVPQSETSAVAKAWINIVEDLKSLGNKLAPLVHLVLGVVDGVLKMVNGVVGEFSHISKGLGLFAGGLFGGGTENNEDFIQWGKEREIRNKASLHTLGNFLPGLISLGNWKPFGQTGDTEAEREASGGMEGLATAATFGLGPASKLLGTGSHCRYKGWNSIWLCSKFNRQTHSF